MLGISSETLSSFAFNALLKSGCRRDVATAVSEGLLWASVRGIDSHGVQLLAHYIRELQSGRLAGNPSSSWREVSETVALLDAGHAPGHYAGKLAMSEAITRASRFGMGLVAVKSSSHCGAMGFFSSMAALEGMLGIAMTNATPRMRTPSSRQVFFGNNPLSMAAPMQGESPFCFDSATTTTTFNKIRTYARAGRQLPDGWAADGEGLPTRDPQEAVQLIPIGDYKGFGLAMVVEILTSVLVGEPSGDQVSEMFGGDLTGRRRLAQTFLAINPGTIVAHSTLGHHVQGLVDRVRSLSSYSPESRVHAPGDPEKETMRARLSGGIPLEPAVAAELAEIAKRFGVEFAIPSGPGEKA